MHPQSKMILLALATICLTMTGCSRQPIEATPAYQAACHGPPLKTIEQRNQAKKKSYAINPKYDCIDKASYELIDAYEVAAAAGNTPEALAKRRVELARLAAEERARHKPSSDDRSSSVPKSMPKLRLVEVNTATESQLRNVSSIGSEVAAKIIAERANGQFKDWADLINRVFGMSSAQSAIYASVSGLTVNAQSLPGAPPDAAIAAAIGAAPQPH